MILYLVIPCYNEEAVLPETSRRLRGKLTALMEAGTIERQSRAVFVDDGSSDRTWELIEGLHAADPLFGGLRLSRNRGHQNALLAGLLTVRSQADAVISLDADLQDDLNAIDGMVGKYLEGCDIVYGVRSSRETDSAFKRRSAERYYRLMNRLGAELVYNHADCRLMSRRALDALAQYGERNLFLRGIVPQLGFRTGVVTYDRAERFAGESKYPLGKMISLAAGGLVSTTTRPLRLLTYCGLGLTCAGFLALLISVIFWCAGAHAAAAVILSSIWAACGLLLSAVAVVGEYVGGISVEVKARPRFFVEQSLLEDEDG